MAAKGRGQVNQRAVSELQDRRVLGGVVFVDAITQTSIVDRLTVTSVDLTLRPNRSGVYAIFDAPGFGALTSQFAPAAAGWPAAQSFEITVSDPSLRYIARRAQVVAPQPLAAPVTPQRVALYAGPARALAPNWAVVRASVTANDGRQLPWAVLQVVKSDNSVIATGMTDARGEAMLAVTGLGVQVSANASGSVTEVTIPVTVQAWFDPGALQQAPGWIPNPDDILANLASNSLKTGQQSGALGPGQTLLAAISISV
jgi:hypothetical protein